MYLKDPLFLMIIMTGLINFVCYFFLPDYLFIIAEAFSVVSCIAIAGKIAFSSVNAMINFIFPYEKKPPGLKTTYFLSTTVFLAISMIWCVACLMCPELYVVFFVSYLDWFKVLFMVSAAPFLFMPFLFDLEQAQKPNDHGAIGQVDPKIVETQPIPRQSAFSFDHSGTLVELVPINPGQSN